MALHSRSRSEHTRSKTNTSGKPQLNPETQLPPQAPTELDATLGYGTSSSFPLFTRGVVSLVKKLFSRKVR